MFETDNAPAQPDILQKFLTLVDYRVARTREELQQAYALVYKEYMKRNYVKTTDSRLKVSIYNAFPLTTTFVAVTGNNEVVATATLVPDSALGLPMDDIYHEELEELRRQKKGLCEITMLASDTDIFGSGVSLMLNSKKLFFIFYLFKIVFDYAKDFVKLDYMCVTIHPKHKLTYDMLLFKDLGGLKTYNNANGAPAIAKFLDLHTCEEECSRTNKLLYKIFFGKKTPIEKLDKKFSFNLDDLKYFFLDSTDVFRNIPPEKIEYIKKFYPAFDFGKIFPPQDQSL